MAGAGIFDGRPTAGLIIHGAYNLPHLQHIVHVTADGNAGQAYLFGNLLVGKELSGPVLQEIPDQIQCGFA